MDKARTHTNDKTVAYSKEKKQFAKAKALVPNL